MRFLRFAAYARIPLAFAVHFSRLRSWEWEPIVTFVLPGIGIIALADGLHSFVKASLYGSILGNVLPDRDGPFRPGGDISALLDWWKKHDLPRYGR